MKKKQKNRRMLICFIIILTILILSLLGLFMKGKLNGKSSSNGINEDVGKGINNNINNGVVDDTSDEGSIVDLETLGIEEYQYPSEFSMGDNLKTAITQMALCYDFFDENTVKSEEWKKTFIARFIQNSRASFDYLDIISDKNNGEIGIEELNYIHYSLTGKELGFSSYVNGTISRYEDASAMNCGSISDYEYCSTEQGGVITADFEVGYDGIDTLDEYELTVNLVKNPYSCFDGYSIVSVSSKAVPAEAVQSGGEHVFYGEDMCEEDNGVFAFEFLQAEDDLKYQHFVYVDMTEAPEMADLVRQNAGKDFEITFVVEGETSGPIENVVPIDVELDE